MASGERGRADLAQLCRVLLQQPEHRRYRLGRAPENDGADRMPLKSARIRGGKADRAERQRDRSLIFALSRG
jgi:hypothetical protein